MADGDGISCRGKARMRVETMGERSAPPLPPLPHPLQSLPTENLMFVLEENSA